MKKYILGFLVGAIAFTGTSVALAGPENAAPFSALWEVATDLQTQIDNLWVALAEIELVPGPKGDPGEPGPKGDTGEQGPAGDPIQTDTVQVLSDQEVQPGEQFFTSYIPVDGFETATILIKRSPLSKVMYLPLFSSDQINDFPDGDFRVMDNVSVIETVVIKAPYMRFNIYNHLNDLNAVDITLYLSNADAAYEYKLVNEVDPCTLTTLGGQGWRVHDVSQETNQRSAQNENCQNAAVLTYVWVLFERSLP